MKSQMKCNLNSTRMSQQPPVGRLSYILVGGSRYTRPALSQWQRTMYFLPCLTGPADHNSKCQEYALSGLKSIDCSVYSKVGSTGPEYPVRGSRYPMHNWMCTPVQMSWDGPILLSLPYLLFFLLLNPSVIAFDPFLLLFSLPINLRTCFSVQNRNPVDLPDPSYLSLSHSYPAQTNNNFSTCLSLCNYSSQVVLL